jgi:putative tRNA adenosine deaminase-associated protein
MADERAASDDGDLGTAYLVLHNEEGWQVSALAPALADDLDGLVRVLLQQPAQQHPIVLVDADGEFFVALRPGHTPGEVRALLSDATAADDDDFAADVLDLADLADDEYPDDADDGWPAGDLAVFADLGVDERELGSILDDVDLYADEMLLAIARRVGFADELAAASESWVDG